MEFSPNRGNLCFRIAPLGHDHDSRFEIREPLKCTCIPKRLSAVCRGKPVVMCILTYSLSVSHCNSRTQQFQRKCNIFFNLYPPPNIWYCLWSDSCQSNGQTHMTTAVNRTAHVALAPLWAAWWGWTQKCVKHVVNLPHPPQIPISESLNSKSWPRWPIAQLCD